MSDIFPVYEFRPIKNLRNMLRYANGDWIEDDGEWDLAFVGEGYALGVFLPYQKGILWSWCALGKWWADVEGHPNKNAWHYMTKNGKDWGGNWEERHKHQNEKAFEEAMQKCCDIFHYANGRGPEFHINDSYIAQGRLRTKETKEIIKFPKIFDCIYCGKLNWRQIEKEAKDGD